MDKEFRKVIRRAERQGWRIKATKKGSMLFPPDGTKEIVTIHGTPSDHRAFNNFMTRMNASGYRDKE